MSNTVITGSESSMTELVQLTEKAKKYKHLMSFNMGTDSVSLCYMCQKRTLTCHQETRQEENNCHVSVCHVCVGRNTKLNVVNNTCLILLQV